MSDGNSAIQCQPKMVKSESLQAWEAERKRIAQKYESQRALCEEEMNKAKEEALRWKDATANEWQADDNPEHYAKIAKIIGENLESRLEKAEREYVKSITAIELESRKEIDKHNNSWNPSTVLQSRDVPSAVPRSPESTESPYVRGNSVSYSSNATPSIVQGQRNLPSVKRKVPQDPATEPKRPRIETPTVSKEPSLRTPRVTPQSGTKPLTDRTTTFDAVSNHPKHKDTIIEFPLGSRNFYVVYCEEHGVHFTRSPAHGAAKHIDGKLHGYLSRSHESAVKTLGYLIVDCNKELARQHNAVVDEAYEKGVYTPENELLRTRGKVAQSPMTGVGNLQSSMTGAGDLQPSMTGVGESSTSKNNKNYFKGIPDPKPYHIYCAYWKGTKYAYPVLILGWDKIDDAGGKEKTLAETRLTHVSESPPNCYLYDQGKIASWAPGFEDGGSKVRSRQFPVMWFDERRSWGWVAAQTLRELSGFKPRGKLKKYFEDADKWIKDNQNFAHEQKRGEVPETIRRATAATGTDQNVPPSPDGEAPNFPTNTTSDGDLEDPELRKLAEKGGDDSSDESYESSGSHERDVSQTIYRKSFFNLRPSGRSNDTVQEAVRTKEPEITGEQKNNKTPERLSAPASFGNSSSTGISEYGMRQARRLSQEAFSLPTNSQGDGIDRSTTVETHNTQKEGQASILGTDHADTIAEPGNSTPQNKGKQRLGPETSDAPVRDNDRSKSTLDKAAPDGTAPTDTALNDTSNEASISTGKTSAELHNDPRKLVLLQHGDSGQGSPSHNGSTSTKPEQLKTSVLQPPHSPQQHHDTSDIPSGPVRFEISQYTNGAVEWKVSNRGDRGIQLFYSTDMKSVLSSKEGAISVKIDSTELRTFSRETHEEKDGNGIITLVFKDAAKPPIKLTFDRSRAKDIDLGKKQALAFTTWLRQERGIKYGCL